VCHGTRRPNCIAGGGKEIGDFGKLKKTGVLERSKPKTGGKVKVTFRTNIGKQKKACAVDGDTNEETQPVFRVTIGREKE